MKRLMPALFASAMLVCGVRGYAAEYHLGEWVGTWQSGTTTGRFNLELNRASDGKFAGNIDVSTDGGKSREYAVDLRTVNFEGDHFTAVFMTPGRSAELVKLSGWLNHQHGSGEWFARKRGATPEQSQADDASASGSWVLEKIER